MRVTFPSGSPWRGSDVMPVTRTGLAHGIRELADDASGAPARRSSATWPLRLLLDELEEPLPAARRRAASRRRDPSRLDAEQLLRALDGRASECPFASAPRRRSATGTGPPRELAEQELLRLLERGAVVVSWSTRSVESRSVAPTWTSAGCVCSSGAASGKTITSRSSNSSDCASFCQLPSAATTRCVVVLGVAAEGEDRAGRAAVAARAGDPVEDVGVGAAVQVDDGERREAPLRGRAARAGRARGGSRRRGARRSCALRNVLIGSRTTSAISFSTTICSRSSYSSGIVILRA